MAGKSKAALELEEATAAYQKVMDESIAQYNALVDKAQSDLNALVQAANPQPQVKPEAQWIEAKDGQQLLILNAAAAEFFSAIFDQVGVLAQELGKMAKKGK